MRENDPSEIEKRLKRQQKKKKSREEINAEKRLWLKNNPDKAREASKRWRDKNSEKTKEYSHQYHEDHREEEAARSHKTYIKHKDRIIAKKKAERADFNKKVALFMGGKCSCCGLETDHYEQYECHHINPMKGDRRISKLLRKDWDFVVVPELRKCVLICRRCHNSLTSQIARSKPNQTTRQKREAQRTDTHKHRCIEYMGGARCQICGYETKDLMQYDFHHLFNKKSDIGSLRYANWDMVIQPELDKCSVLCANCHISVHVGRYDYLILIPGPIEFYEGKIPYIVTSSSKSQA